MAERVVKVGRIGKYDTLITTEVVPNWLFRLFGAKPYERQYRGDCTVWHSYPDGERCGTFTESWLCDVWQANKWKKEKKS